MGYVMKNYLDDVLVIIGCLVLLFATYQLSLIAFWYLLGVLLIGAGITIGISERRKGN